MATTLTFVIENRMEEIPPANERISGWLRDHGAHAAAIVFSTLCVEEIVSNCVKYGYPDAALHQIALSIGLEPRKVLVEIQDDGREFNPLTAPEPDLSGPVEKRPVGGLGLRMVREMADGADYRREGGVNRLTLWKSLS